MSCVGFSMRWHAAAGSMVDHGRFIPITMDWNRKERRATHPDFELIDRGEQSAFHRPRLAVLCAAQSTQLYRFRERWNVTYSFKIYWIVLIWEPDRFHSCLQKSLDVSILSGIVFQVQCGRKGTGGCSVNLLGGLSLQIASKILKFLF